MALSQVGWRLGRAGWPEAGERENVYYSETNRQRRRFHRPLGPQAVGKHTTTGFYVDDDGEIIVTWWSFENRPLIAWPYLHAVVTQSDFSLVLITTLVHRSRH